MTVIFLPSCLMYTFLLFKLSITLQNHFLQSYQFTIELELLPSYFIIVGNIFFSVLVPPEPRNEGGSLCCCSDDRQLVPPASTGKLERIPGPVVSRHRFQSLSFLATLNQETPAEWKHSIPLTSFHNVPCTIYMSKTLCNS